MVMKNGCEFAYYPNIPNLLLTYRETKRYSGTI